MEKNLCKHVRLYIDKEEKILSILKGPAFYYFGWSRKEQLDTPRLRCSDCNKYIHILGYKVVPVSVQKIESKYG